MRAIVPGAPLVESRNVGTGAHRSAGAGFPGGATGTDAVPERRGERMTTVQHQVGHVTETVVSLAWDPCDVAGSGS